ncbi:hypothetical protein K1T71_001367 [Dendrolimus kikuchii]|uniref:Uncharacterized protein n=1 Tax=Dendrolimus kikuchii TaxID=765133 RepID=A0ACC1DJ31_9NEOP|nr:hypothetical protein K1T71_001367 [Dendrolimus kikuchii]
MRWTAIITFTCALANVICAPADVLPCSVKDKECLTDLTRRLFQSAVTGNKEMGITTSDPMYQEFVEGNFDTVKYTLTQSKLYGFKDCIIESTSISPDEETAEIQMICPKFRMTSKFVIVGDLIGVPTNGDGDLIIEATDVHITVSNKLERITGDGGISALALKIIKVNPKISGSLVFKVDNVNNRDKSVPTETIVKVFNENWPAAAEILQGPIFDSSIKNLADNINTYLKTKPSDTLIKS